jgi:hypothetical protein
MRDPAAQPAQVRILPLPYRELGTSGTQASEPRRIRPVTGRRQSAFVLIFFAVQAFGCGGSDTRKPLNAEERSVAAALHAYVSALSVDDFEKACALMTPQDRNARRPYCAASLKRAFGAAYTRDDAASFHVRSVEVTGDKAVATTDNKDRTKTPLRKIAGRWLVGAGADKTPS